MNVPDILRHNAHGRGGIMVEIGVLEGKTGEILAQEADVVILIDTFDGRGSNHTERVKDNPSYFIAQAYQRLKKYQSNTIIWAGNSDLAVNLVEDGSISLLFLDSDHRYNQITKDLSLWLPKIKRGGVFMGHDYNGSDWDERYINEDFVGGKHHGVSKAVHEHFGNNFEWYPESTVWMVQI